MYNDAGFRYNKYLMRKIILLLTLLPFLAFAKTETVVYNVTNNQVITGSLADTEKSIASISKLMTIYTVLKADQDLDEKLTVRSQRTPNTKLQKGMRLTRRELIDLALVSSDNIAAITLGENYPGGMNYFVYQMNKHADELRMFHTGFVEPTGLSPMNYSSISDVVTLARAVSEFKQVQSAAKTQKEVNANAEGVKTVKKYKNRHKVTREGERKITAHPTSNFFGREGIVTIKTGFTRAAGFCITMLVMSNDKLYNITVLGAKTKQERQRIVEQSLKKIHNV
jgi:D-alanyl-D-alanine endopeptidase (penicillin-binding protein 7)